MVALRIGYVLGGVVLIGLVVDAAVRTFVLPRGVVVGSTRLISTAIRKLFDLRLRWARTFEVRDRILAMYAPAVLLGLVVAWLVLLVAGFTLVFAAIDGISFRDAFIEAGSSLFTLGFARPPGTAGTVVSFVAAAFGLGVVALLIAYLPTLYSAFSRREVLVAYLSARAGSPASAIELLQRAHLINRLGDLDDFWERFQLWFAELEETHTSLPLLNFFRSPVPDRSWVTAAGTVLDAASLVNSTIDVTWQPMAGLCVRSGFTALRSVGDFFAIPHPVDPRPDDPITITRSEWETACAELEAAGVPLVADRDQAWRDFAGWRVNYDTVLVTLAGFLEAPYARWSSDRSVAYRVRAVPWARRPRR